MNFEDARTPQRPANTRLGRGRGRGRGATQRQKRGSTPRRRNRRADQFCVYLVADERQIPVYAVEFKAPHKVTTPELVAGLHPMNLARNVLGQEGDTLDLCRPPRRRRDHSDILIRDRQWSSIRLHLHRGSFRFVHIPKNDPTIVQHSCVSRIKMYKRTMHCASAGPLLVRRLRSPLKRWLSDLRLKKWHDVAHDKLKIWKVA